VKYKWLVILATLICLLSGIGGYIIWVKSKESAVHTINGLLWPKIKALTDFTLTSHQGKPFTLKDLQHRWSLLFFGYTHCPDICPVTLTILRDVKVQLQNLASNYVQDTQFVFISVDGERDTPSKLANYLSYFDSQFFGATGTPLQVNVLTRQLGIVYIQHAGRTPNQYFIDHSANILLINPRAEWVGNFTAPHLADAIVTGYIKMRQFLQEHSP
jgi:protein SCO1/2